MYKCKALKKLLARQQKRVHITAENELPDNHITWAEDIHTDKAKNNPSKQSLAIDKGPPNANQSHLHSTKWPQCGICIATAIQRTLHFFQQVNQVHFNNSDQVRIFQLMIFCLSHSIQVQMATISMSLIGSLPSFLSYVPPLSGSL